MFKNLVGQQFGKLTVIELDESRTVKSNRVWRCLCECGNTISVAGTSLTRQRRSTTQCGYIVKAHKLLDLTGKTFEKLTVTTRADKTSYGSATWNCVCECGNKAVVASTHLVNGNTTSCGCVHKDTSRSRAIENNKSLIGKNFKYTNNDKECVLTSITTSVLNKIYNRYKRDALQTNRVFELSKQHVLKIIQDKCFYCGKAPYTICKSDYKDEKCFYTGIDRLDSNLGYTNLNVVSCCSRCNYSKNNATLVEFKEMVSDIYQNMNLAAKTSSCTLGNFINGGAERHILGALSL